MSEGDARASHALPSEGDVLGGKYRIMRPLGAGGMGVVYEALNLMTDAPVAVKLLRPGRGLGRERRERLLREARAAARLKSRFVARVFDLDRSDEQRPVLVMELLSGNDLGAEIRRLERIPLGDAIAYLVQACAGVAEAHAVGIIHRDLKPGNLFLDAGAGGTPTIRVLDFGLSKFMLSDLEIDLTHPDRALGTLSYMSPEQLRNERVIDARSDVWSLGLILYRALSGHLPFNLNGVALATRILAAEQMPPLPSNIVPHGLALAIAKALAMMPGDRFPDARAFGQALAPFLGRTSAMTALALEELEAPAPVRWESLIALQELDHDALETDNEASVEETAATLEAPTSETSTTSGVESTTVRRANRPEVAPEADLIDTVKKPAVVRPVERHPPMTAELTPRPTSLTSPPATDRSDPTGPRRRPPPARDVTSASILIPVLGVLVLSALLLTLVAWPRGPAASASASVSPSSPSASVPSPTESSAPGSLPPPAFAAVEAPPPSTDPSARTPRPPRAKKKN